MFQWALRCVVFPLSLSAPFALSAGWDWLIATTEWICNVLRFNVCARHGVVVLTDCAADRSLSIS